MRIYSAQHPKWNRKLILHHDGTFVCGQRVKGTWVLEDDELQLIWYRKKPQILHKTDLGFSDEKLQLSPYFINKIFGIGFHRTGTRTLCTALNSLQLPTDHYRLGRTFFSNIKNQNYCLPGRERFIGYTDLPIPLVFKELDQQYPGSKFILTIRDPESWITSVNRHLHRLSEKQKLPRDREIHQYCYGIGMEDFGDEADKTRLDRYLQHNDDVLEYFRERPHDLLVFNLMGGDEWEKLCPFLRERIPKRRFPAVGKRRHAPEWNTAAAQLPESAGSG